MSTVVLTLLFAVATAQDAAPEPEPEPATESAPVAEAGAASEPGAAAEPAPEADSAPAQQQDAADPDLPAKGSPEEAVRESLLLMKAGDTEGWMDRWCVPQRCATPVARQDLEAYMLKQATKSAANCLHGDKDTLKITSIKGDPAADAKLSIRLECSHTKFPPPAVLEKVDGRWYVSSIPW